MPLQAQGLILLEETIQFATASINDATTETDDFNAGMTSFIVNKVVVSKAARVRLYIDLASATADTSRGEEEDAIPSDGQIFELITTTDNQVVYFDKAVIGHLSEVANPQIAGYNVTNKSGGAVAITTTLHVQRLL